MSIYFDFKTDFIDTFQDPFDWGQVDKSALAKCLMTLCRQVKDIMMEEPRLIKLQSPVYILGKVSGHCVLQDLNSWKQLSKFSRVQISN